MDNEIKLFVEEILFVIVLYKKALIESESFAGIEALAKRGAICSVFLYDNSPESLKPVGSFTNGQRLEYPNEKLQIFYHHDASNSGVAKAYNEGFVVAKKLSKKWMMLLDQDTELNPDVFGSFFQASNAFPEEVAFVPILRDRFGIVSPFRWRFGRGIRPKNLNDRVLQLRRWRFMNSGLVVSVIAFEKCGGYNERIGLDFSDIAFGERLNRVTGYFRVIDFKLHHRFSGSDIVTVDLARNRYRKFCLGAKELSQHSMGLAVLTNAFLHGLKLSIRHSDFSFMKIFFQTR